jgi:TolA-binding protein
MTTFRRILLVAIPLTTGACFATRNDVRIIQGDIFAMRAAVARADSQRAQQIAAIQATLAVAYDSLRHVSGRLNTLEGDTRQSFYSIDQQLLQIGELVGQGQNKLADLRAEMERRNQAMLQQQQMAAQAAAADTAGGKPPTGVQPAGGVSAPPTVPPEGPYQLYQQADQLLRQGAFSTARSVLQQLLAQYDTSDIAPDAQQKIAASFESENRLVEADSAYRLVVAKYPRSAAAPTALFKHAMLLDKQGKRTEARTAMMQVMRQYPGSDEFTLARDWLERNPQ